MRACRHERHRGDHRDRARHTSHSCLHAQLGVLVVAIRRATGEMIATPNASEVLAAGDVLIAIGAPAKVQELGARLTVPPRPPAQGKPPRS